MEALTDTWKNLQQIIKQRDAELAGWDPADEDSGGEESDEAGSVAPGLTRLLRRISDKFG